MYVMGLSLTSHLYLSGTISMFQRIGVTHWKSCSPIEMICKRSLKNTTIAQVA